MFLHRFAKYERLTYDIVAQVGLAFFIRQDFLATFLYMKKRIHSVPLSESCIFTTPAAFLPS